MNKAFAKLFSIIIAICFFCVSIIPAYAVEYMTDSDDPSDAIPMRRAIIFPDRYDSDEGTEYLLFQMNLGKVYNTVNTFGNSAKTFTKTSIYSRGATIVYLRGHLYHSTDSSSSAMRTGVGYYDIDDDEVEALYYLQPTSGSVIHDYIFYTSDLSNNISYIGFVTNTSTRGGYVTGDVAVYYR